MVLRDPRGELGRLGDAEILAAALASPDLADIDAALAALGPAADCDHLAPLLLGRFERSGEQHDLDRAVEVSESTESPVTVRCRGQILLHRWRRGSAGDLERAITTLELALDRARSDTSLSSAVAVELARALDARWLIDSQRSDLDRALLLLDDVRARPEGWAWLAAHVELRVHRAEVGGPGEESALDAAIDVATARLMDASEDHVDRPRLQTSLATAHRHRWLQSGNSTDLDRALELDQQALAATRPGHVEHASRLAVSGVRLTNQWARSGDRNALDRALNAQERALELVPVGWVERGSVAAKLALRYSYRWLLDNDPADLDRAVELQEEALAAAGERHRNWPTRASSLAIRLSYRWSTRGDPADLERAVRLQRLALARTDRASPKWATRASALAFRLSARWQAFGSRHDLDRAIGLQQRAIERNPNSRASHGLRPAHIAACLLERDPSDLPSLGRAIDLLRHAAEHVEDGGWAAPERLARLTEALARRALLTGSAADAAEATSVAERLTRSLSKGHASTLVVARHAPDAARALSSLRSESARIAAVELGRRVIEVAEALARLEFDPSGPQRTLTEDGWVHICEGIDGLGALTAMNVVLAGQADATTPGSVLSAVHEAIELVERTSTTVAAREAARVIFDRARIADSAIASEFEAAAAEWRSLAVGGQAAGTAPAGARDLLEARRAAALAEVERVAGRQVVGTVRFADLATIAASRQQPLVWLAATPIGGLALRLEPSGAAEHVVLPSFTAEAVWSYSRRLARDGFDEPIDSSRRSVRSIRNDGEPATVPGQALLSELQTWIASSVGPVLDWLPGAAFMPVGPVARLPLLLALPEHDSKRLSVGARPVSLSLLADQRPLNVPRRGSVLVCVDPVLGPPAAPTEVEQVVNLHNGDLALDTGLRWNEIRRRSQPARVIHIAVHGIDRRYDGRTFRELPALQFADEYVHPSDFAEIAHLLDGCELLFINSCCSGATAERMADQSRGFATLAAVYGARYVIAANYPIFDDTAAAFAVRVHRDLARGATVPEAYWRAWTAMLNSPSADTATLHAYVLHTCA